MAGRCTFQKGLKGINTFCDSILTVQGKGDAIDILLKDITNTRPQLAEKITEKIHVDDSHLTDRQVLQLARRIVFGEDPRKPRRIHGQALPPSEFGALDFRGL